MRDAAAVIFLAVLLLPGRLSFAGAQSEYAFLTYPVEKVLPKTRPYPKDAVKVRLAGNEYESVILGLWNPTGRAVSVSSVRLTRMDPGACRVTLYRVGTIPVRQASRWFAPVLGDWPDPLVPLAPQAEDDPPGSNSTTWVPERPVAVPPGENRTFLLEIYLPTGERNGETLAVSLLLSDGRELPLTIEVSPWGFDLPREQAMATAFMFYSSAVLAGHAALSAALSGAEAPPPPANLPRDYVHLLARYGISVGRLYEGSPASRNPDGSLTFDWTGFDSSVGAALDGTLFPDAPPATSFAVPDLPPDCTPGQRKAFYAEVVAHMREKGWLSRMYSYVSDEPTRADYPAVHAIAAEIKGFDPGIRTLLTEPWVSELSDVIDIWVVDLPYIGDSVPVMPVSARWPFRFSLDWQINPRPSRYLAARDAGQASWIYTCDSSVFLDYPNLFIDADAAAARVIPWLAFRYGFTGLLYWNVLSHYTGNPWVDQYGFMANGDGDLLYPGVPGLPDIHEHSPIPSLRLQLLRDGFEDYQYLALLGQAQGAESAREIAAEVARSSLAWAHYTADIERVREQVAEALTRR